MLGVAGFEQGSPLNLASDGEVRIFEDVRSVVGVAYFRSWKSLEAEWSEAQAVFVDRISSRFKRSEAKAWDGYLVLMTVDSASSESVAVIRRDTSRVRKLVATGTELTSIEAVTEILLPVLPLDLGGASSSPSSLLERLPQMVERRGVHPDVASAAISAFEENRSPMEGIAALREFR